MNARVVAEGRSLRRATLWTAVVACVLVPVTLCGVRCDRAAAAAAADQPSGGPHGCYAPRPLRYASALITPDGVGAGARGLALGWLITAPWLAGATFLEWRARRRSDPRARPRWGPLLLLALGTAGTGGALALALRYQLHDQQERDRAQRCRAHETVARSRWESYRPRTRAGEQAVSRVRHAIGYYALEDVCAAARAVPADPGDPAYVAAMRETLRHWELCRDRAGPPTCLAVP